MTAAFASSATAATMSVGIALEGFPAVAGDITTIAPQTNSCYPVPGGDRPMSDASTVTYTCP